MEFRNPSPGLYNEDLAPAWVRNWGAFSIFTVWIPDVHSLWATTSPPACSCRAAALPTSRWRSGSARW